MEPQKTTSSQVDSFSRPGASPLVSAPLPALQPEQESLIEQSIHHISKFSRTFRGIGDTSVSDLKLPPLLEGEDLAQAAQDNFRRAVHFLISQREVTLEDPLEVQELIERTIAICNQDIVDPQAGLYRKWDGRDTWSAIKEIVADLGDFHVDYLQRRNSATTDSVEFALWIEREYNTKIHPLADGCGRTSKALSTAELIRAGYAFPEFDHRDQYFGVLLMKPEPALEAYRNALAKQHKAVEG